MFIDKRFVNRGIERVMDFVAKGTAPAVSVIIPVYRVEKYLERCLESVLNQSFMDFEVILVDDGSDDGCACICDNYAMMYDMISVIHTENHGLSAARNTGIETARGEYIAFVDSDDWIHADYLKILVQNIGDAAMCCCGKIKVSEFVADTEAKPVTAVLIKCEKAVKRNDCCVTAWGKLYRRSFIADYRYDAGLKLTSEDRVFNALLLANNPSEKVAVVNACLYYYFQHDEAITRNKAFSDLPAIEKMIGITESTKCEALLVYLIEWMCMKRETQFHIGNPPDSAKLDRYLDICGQLCRMLIPGVKRKIKYKLMIYYPGIYILTSKILCKARAYGKSKA